MANETLYNNWYVDIEYSYNKDCNIQGYYR